MSTHGVIETAQDLIAEIKAAEEKKAKAIMDLWAERKAIDEALTAFGVDPDSRPRKPRADKGTKRSRTKKGGVQQSETIQQA